MTYSALVFDFFGVICSEVAPFWLARHFSEGDAISVKAQIVHAADRGEISQDALFEGLSKLTNVPLHLIEEEWLGYVHVDQRMIAFVKELRSRHKLCLVTNATSPFFRKIAARHGIEPLFETIVVSSEVGSAKPEQAIYRLALERLNVEPQQALMIDDNPTNVEAAIGIGMNALLYRSFEQLRAALC